MAILDMRTISAPPKALSQTYYFYSNTWLDSRYTKVSNFHLIKLV